MQDFSNIDVNGQLLFIEPIWVTGETCLFSITNPIEHAVAKAKVTKFRKRFIEQLEVRYIALMMCMKKKLEAKNACDETFKPKIKYNKKGSSL